MRWLSQYILGSHLGLLVLFGVDGNIDHWRQKRVCLSCCFCDSVWRPQSGERVLDLSSSRVTTVEGSRDLTPCYTSLYWHQSLMAHWVLSVSSHLAKLFRSFPMFHLHIYHLPWVLGCSQCTQGDTETQRGEPWHVWFQRSSSQLYFPGLVLLSTKSIWVLSSSGNFWEKSIIKTKSETVEKAPEGWMVEVWFRLPTRYNSNSTTCVPGPRTAEMH